MNPEVAAFRCVNLLAECLAEINAEDRGDDLVCAVEHAHTFTGIAPATRQDRTLTVFPVISTQGLFTKGKAR